MKVLRKDVLALLLAIGAICVIGGVVSAGNKNYFELNLYEKTNLGDFDAAELEAYYWIFDYHGRYDWNDEEQSESDYLTEGDMLIATSRCTGECVNDEDIVFEVNSSLTAADNRVFDFTDEEKTELTSYSTPLADYDGIILRVAEEPEPECESVCIVKVKAVDSSSGARQKSSPVFDGLNVSFDLYFEDYSQFMQYAIAVVNNTSGDLRISTDVAETLVGYDIEIDDANFSAGERKDILVKVYLNGTSSNEEIITGSLAINIQPDEDPMEDGGSQAEEPKPEPDDSKEKQSNTEEHKSEIITPGIVNPSSNSEGNPNTFEEPVALIPIIACGALLIVVFVESKLTGNRRHDKKLLVIGALLGLAVLLPTGISSAETKYKLSLTTRIELPRFINITFKSNANDASSEKVVQRVKSGEEVLLETDIFTRPYYNLSHWNTKPDGTGADYSSFVGHDYVYFTFQHDITLYAVWDQIIYFGTKETANGWDYTISDRPVDGFEWAAEWANNGGDHAAILMSKINKSREATPGTPFAARYDRATNIRVVGQIAPTNLSYLFDRFGVGSDQKPRFRIDVSELDTSNATTMRAMFAETGARNFQPSKRQDWSIVGLSNWDVSNVINMSSMFESAGWWAADCRLDLKGWNTASLTSMSYMFNSACKKSNSLYIDLSSFNMSKVTGMASMFYATGEEAEDWTVIIPPTNGNGLANTSTRMYGADESVYVDAPTGRSFTIGGQ